MVTITGVDDDIDNSDELRWAYITHTVAGADYDGEFLAGFTVRILDDDPDPTVTLALDPASIGEGGDTTAVTVTLDRASDADTTITVAAGPATGSNPAETGDFTLSGTTLTIARGATASTGTVTITSNEDDDTLEDRVAVSATASNDEGVVNPADVVLTITDNDTPGVTLAAADPLIVAEGGQERYTLVLNFQPGSNVVINVAASRQRGRYGPAGPAHLHSAQLERCPGGCRQCG